MRLDQHAVDDVDIDGFLGGSDGFEHAGDAEVASFTQDAIGGSNDQIECRLREDVVAEADAVEFGEDESLHVVGIEAFGDDRIRDAALDVLVDVQGQAAEQGRLADEDQIMVLGEVLKKQPQLTEGVHLHQMGVVDDGDQGYAVAVVAEGLGDEPLLEGESVALEFGIEGFAQDLDGIGVGMEGAADRGDELTLVLPLLEGFLDDGFASSRIADDQAQSALLAMDAQGIVDFLLPRQQVYPAGGKRVICESVIGSNHGLICLSSEEAVGNEIEGMGDAHALAFVVNDDGAGAVALVADLNGFVAKIDRGFVAVVLEAEGIVLFDLPFGFGEKEFVAGFGGWQEADAF